MTRILDAIGLYVLCVGVGVVFDQLGLKLHTMPNHPWHMRGSLLDKAGEAIAWSAPHALRGAIIVVPVVLIGLLQRWRRRRRQRGY